MSPRKSVITINNQNNNSNLLITANESGFSLSLESSNDEIPPSPNFFLHKNHEAFGVFSDFCESINKVNNSVLLDEVMAVEFAPFVFFQRCDTGVWLRFCCQNGTKPKVRHILDKGDARITKIYAELFTSLAHIKHNNKTQAEYAMS